MGSKAWRLAFYPGGLLCSAWSEHGAVWRDYTRRLCRRVRASDSRALTSAETTAARASSVIRGRCFDPRLVPSFLSARERWSAATARSRMHVRCTSCVCASFVAPVNSPRPPQQSPPASYHGEGKFIMLAGQGRYRRPCRRLSSLAFLQPFPYRLHPGI